MTVTATLFLVMAIVHLLRIILGWLAVPVASALAYFGFTLKR